MISQSLNERRQQTSKLIQELLDERREVWSEYSHLAGMRPFQPSQPLKSAVRKFCQLLIDYVSLGHFGLLQRIADGNERRRKVIDLAGQYYQRIAEVTQVAVDFNDAYEKLDGDSIQECLARDLSSLGENLAARFELEDRLIESMTA
jgi:regulator of sigma D